MKLKPLFLLFLPIFAAAQSPVDGYVAEILANNPELRAQRAAASAEIINRIASNRLGAAEAGFAYKWPSIAGEVTKIEFEVSQSFDWPGVYGARRRSTSAARRASADRVAAAEKEIRLQIREQLYELIFATDRVDLLSRMVENIDTLHVHLHRLLDNGEATELDHRKLLLEEVALRQQLTDALQTRTEAFSAIATLNGGELPAGIGELRESGSEDLKPLEEYLAVADFESRALESEAEVMRLDARAERMGLAPGFSVGYVMEKEGPVYYNGFSVGLRLPDYGAKTRAEAMDLQAGALKAQAQTAAADRLARLTADYSSVEKAARLIAEYEKAFGHNYEKLLQRALDGGQMTYIDYFNELNYYLTARIDYINARLNYHKLLNRLAQ